MKAWHAGLFLLLCALLVVPAALAAGITITSDKTDYYFALGDTAAIALPVTNTYDHDIDGTLQFTTVEQLQNTGSTLTSTKNRVYTTTVPSGSSYINISAGTSNVPESIQIQVAFQYTDPSATQVTLPTITVHFVQDPAQYTQSQGGKQTSTSGAATSAFGSSSVQVMQQSVSVQQQAGRDASQSSSSALQNNQMSQDTSALKEQLQREAAEKEQAKKAFAQALDADPLVRQVNETLAADGYSRASVDTTPTSGSDGSFAMTYQNAAGEQVTLNGAMTQGVVPSVLEQSATTLNVTSPLAANTTYQSFVRTLSDKGYTRNTTLTNVTLTGAMVNVTYLTDKGTPGFVNATVENGNVTQVSLGLNEKGPDYLLIAIIAVVLVIAAVCAWLIWRRLKARKPVLPAVVSPLRPTPVPLDYRKEALRLLAEAEAAYGRHEFRDAYGLAGRAARVFLSYYHGDRRELTNAELVSVLAASRRPGAEVIGTILERTSDVEFAKGMPDDTEFAAIIRQIRELVT
ncbi:hypothetical protein [Methanoregula sp. UBA64]|jgi:hypothetical protein|uniref:hypothetical protein n=1 Tax=Methanoregula sp. UBA64 TaxID=1915554 RepID=UPI0025DF72C3|nr:hypothetical protein [Methanoregula sp. UBA64]